MHLDKPGNSFLKAHIRQGWKASTTEHLIKGTQGIYIYIYIYILISRLSNILTKKGQALEYTGSIEKKEKQKKKMSRGAHTNHPKQLGALDNTHKQAYNRVLPLINYTCPRSEGSYERMFQSSGRETIIIKDYLPSRSPKEG